MQQYLQRLQQNNRNMWRWVSSWMERTLLSRTYVYKCVLKKVNVLQIYVVYLKLINSLFISAWNVLKCFHSLVLEKVPFLFFNTFDSKAIFNLKKKSREVKIATKHTWGKQIYIMFVSKCSVQAKIWCKQN